MLNRYNRMIQKHSRTTEAHDLSYLFSLFWFITMDAAVRTERFVHSLRTPVNTFVSIVQQVTARSTELPALMLLPAVQGDHGLNYPLFPDKTIRAHQARRTRLNDITTMPAMTPPMATWCSPYFSAVGNSSSREM